MKEDRCLNDKNIDSSELYQYKLSDLENIQITTCTIGKEFLKPETKNIISCCGLENCYVHKKLKDIKCGGVAKDCLKDKKNRVDDNCTVDKTVVISYEDLHKYYKKKSQPAEPVHENAVINFNAVDIAAFEKSILTNGKLPKNAEKHLKGKVLYMPSRSNENYCVKFTGDSKSLEHFSILNTQDGQHAGSFMEFFDEYRKRNVLRSENDKLQHKGAQHTPRQPSVPRVKAESLVDDGTYEKVLGLAPSVLRRKVDPAKGAHAEKCQSAQCSEVLRNRIRLLNKETKTNVPSGTLENMIKNLSGLNQQNLYSCGFESSASSTTARGQPQSNGAFRGYTNRPVSQEEYSQSVMENLVQFIPPSEGSGGLQNAQIQLEMNEEECKRYGISKQNCNDFKSLILQTRANPPDAPV